MSTSLKFYAFVTILLLLLEDTMSSGDNLKFIDDVARADMDPLLLALQRVPSPVTEGHDGGKLALSSWVCVTHEVGCVGEVMVQGSAFMKI